MHGAKQRKGIESYQLQQLRNVLKSDSNEMQKEFVSKYRELKIESNRGKQAPRVDAFIMGKRSLSRQRFHDQRTRRDSKGRDFYQERKSRADSRGRKYHRKYYRGSNERQRSFSRDMRSLSRGRSNSSDERNRRTERGRSQERRGTSKNRNRQNTCIACTCENCERMRKTSSDLNVNWCEEYNEEILINFTEKGKQVMILDLGAPVSIAGEEWIKQYLENHGVELRDLKSYECHQTFKF